jgi:hypothetical protein
MLHHLIKLSKMSIFLKTVFQGTVVALSTSNYCRSRPPSVKFSTRCRLRVTPTFFMTTSLWYSDMSNHDHNHKIDDSTGSSKSSYHDRRSSSSSSFFPHAHSLSNGRLKQYLRRGWPLTGVVTGQYRDTDHVEQLGLLGYDFLWADCEHSTASPDHVLKLIIAAERRNMPTLVRIGYGYQNIIGYVNEWRTGVDMGESIVGYYIAPSTYHPTTC